MQIKSEISQDQKNDSQVWKKFTMNKKQNKVNEKIVTVLANCNYIYNLKNKPKPQISLKCFSFY